MIGVLTSWLGVPLALVVSRRLRVWVRPRRHSSSLFGVDGKKVKSPNGRRAEITRV